MRKILLLMATTLLLAGCPNSESSKKETCALISSGQITLKEGAQRLGLDVSDGWLHTKVSSFCAYYLN